MEDAATFSVDRQVLGATPDEFDALLLPGGTLNPDTLRMEDCAVSFVQALVGAPRPS